MYYFITNIHGAGGNALLVWKKIKKILISRGVPFKLLLSERKEHATELARSVCENADSDKNIIVVGGDGTINEVLNGITEKDFSNVKFGVIPTGSGNDFCRGAGIKRGSRNTKKVLEKVLSSSVRKMDVGKVTFEENAVSEKTLSEQASDGGTEKSRYFGISSGIGMDAIVCRKVDSSSLKKYLNFFKLGGLAYILFTLHTLCTMKFYKVKVKLSSNESASEGSSENLSEKSTVFHFERLIFLSAMNLKAEGGGVKMAPKALCDDGKLSLCAVNGFPRFVSYLVFPFLVLGIHSKLKGFTVRKFDSLEVESDSPMVLHTDGEFAGEVTKVSWKVLPSVLQLLN